MKTGITKRKSTIRERLHQFVETTTDKKAKALYALFEDEIAQITDEDGFEYVRNDDDLKAINRFKSLKEINYYLRFLTLEQQKNVLNPVKA